MHDVCKWIVKTWTWICVLGLLGASSVIAAEQRSFAGWEKGGAYDNHYKASDFDQFKGTVEDIVEITPLPGMAIGVGLLVRDEGKEIVKVHLGPKDFVDLKTIALKKGDKVKIKGAWAEINGDDILMASKVKKGETTELKLRLTKDGTPFWTMSPEEIARELEKD
jgi:hypothetical protein